MGKEYEAWSMGCFYGLGLDVAYTTSIHIPVARAQSYCLPSSKRAQKKPSNCDPRQKRNWVCEHPAVFATMFFSLLPIKENLFILQGQTKFHLLWKAFLNYSEGSENSLFWSFTIPIIFVTYFTLATHQIAKLLFFLIVHILSSPV